MIGLGRVSEVTRDEVKFTKFIIRLRNKFSQIFDSALGTQLALKGICTKEEWENFKEYIYYDYKKDNNFTEMRDAEILRERLNLLGAVDPYLGRYFSASYVKKKVLQMTEQDIEEMQKEMEEEQEKGIGQPPQDGQQDQVDSNQYPPEDNTVEEGSTESKTPQLDDEVERYASLLNRR
jgi:hypothetical protein